MKKATIYSYSIIRSATEAFVDRVPYCCAVLELEDGNRISALVEGYEDGMAVEIGMEVKCIESEGKLRYSL